jgi:hypothetical protein
MKAASLALLFPLCAQADTYLIQPSGDVFNATTGEIILRQPSGDYYRPSTGSFVLHDQNSGYYDIGSGEYFSRSPNGSYLGTDGDQVTPFPGGFQTWP